MANREPDPRFESEYHPRGEYARNDRAEWNAFNGDSSQDRRSQQADAEEQSSQKRSSWYERNNRRNQAHLQHQAAEQYREDFGHPGYGERYGFSGYGRSDYDPDINRGFTENPEVETWREGTRFTDREQDYRGGRWNRETHGYHNGDGRMWRGPSPENPESRGYADYSGGSTEHDVPNSMNTMNTRYFRSYDNRFGRGGFAGIAPKNYQRSDARIEEEICERLTANPFIDPSNMEIKVSQGEVTLSGDIADRRMKRMAEDLAEDTPGVRNVNNQIQVRQATTVRPS